jgi:WhiB family redox-sensing transcriptional regulator
VIQAEKRPDWFKQGLCWGRPEITNLFFPEKEEDCNQGRQYCERCPVRQQCLDYAIHQEIHFGLWGGLTYRERERYKRNPAAFIAKKSTCEYCGEILGGKRRLFCSTRCVRLASSKRKREGTQILPGTCEMCGKEFARKNAGQKLCGPECQKQSANLRTARNRTVALRTVGCWVCGDPTSAYAKYCSDPCRAKARKNERKFAS